MIISSLIGYTHQKYELKKALLGIEKQYSELLKPSTGVQGLSKKIEKLNNLHPKSKGEFGEIEKFMKEFMYQMASQKKDYLLELEAIGWNKLLDPNRIKADKTFIESKVIIQKAKEIVKKYTKKTQILLKNARDKICSLNVSISLKRSMLSGFDNGMKKAKKNIDTMWALEAKVITEAENIINLLSARRGAWIIKNGKILFYEKNDLYRFNSYITSIQNIAKQQKKIKYQSVQIINRIFEHMKKIE